MRAVQAMSMKTFDELLICLGYGRVTPEDILPHVIPKDELEKRATVAAREEDKSFQENFLLREKERDTKRHHGRKPG